MGKRDKRVDAYIDRSADFAKPILAHIRGLVHRGCPQVEETMKWSAPHFDYKGMMCSMAAFKEHCVFGFWKAKLMKDAEGVFSSVRENAMGQFGRIRSKADLPSDSIMLRYLREAVRLNDEGTSLRSGRNTRKKALRIPPVFRSAINKNKKARVTFDGFSPSNKRDYVEWISEAKTTETRNKRLETAIRWMAEGKVRNWKYLKT